MSGAFDYTVFGIYEIFGNVIPGFILLVSFLILEHFAYRTDLLQLGIPESIIIIVAVFVAFTLGVAVQGFSSYVGKEIQNRKYGGYPSSLYLDMKDETFPPYFKETVRKIAHEKFGTPPDASPAHVFDLCYTYVVQKIGSVRVSQFLALYTFSRNMMVAMMVEAALVLGWSVTMHQYALIAVGAGAMGIGYLFYRRFLTYSESFAKEVFRSFVAGAT